MGSLHFESPSVGRVPSYAILDFDPMGFQSWLDALRDLFHQLEEANDHANIRNYQDLFDEDVRQYTQHLLRMAPFSRPHVSLYNIIYGETRTTRELNQLVEASEWADGQLPESFVALMQDAIRIGLPPGDAFEAMKVYGNLIIALAESFLGNDRRRISTIVEAENIHNLFRVVAEPFVAHYQLPSWEKIQIAGA